MPKMAQITVDQPRKLRRDERSWIYMHWVRKYTPDKVLRKCERFDMFEEDSESKFVRNAEIRIAIAQIAAINTVSFISSLNF